MAPAVLGVLIVAAIIVGLFVIFQPALLLFILLPLVALAAAFLFARKFWQHAGPSPGSKTGGPGGSATTPPPSPPSSSDASYEPVRQPGEQQS